MRSMKRPVYSICPVDSPVDSPVDAPVDVSMDSLYSSSIYIVFIYTSNLYKAE